jgi:hypothetical protein
MNNTINPDLAKERSKSTIDLAHMKQFLGEYIYTNKENYFKMLNYSLFSLFYINFKINGIQNNYFM